MLALESTIDSVTVYRQGARITRLAEVSRGGDGYPERVRLPGLPLSLIDSSVRARVLPVSGGAAGLPIAADVRVTLDVARQLDHLPPADDRELEEARLAEAEQAALVAQIEREIERLNHLDLRARAAEGRETAVPSIPLAARLELLELRDDSWRRLRAELEGEREELRERRRRLRALEDRDRRASSARRPRESELRKCAVVTLRGGTAAAARLAIDYRVPGARWAPAYVARLDAAGDRVELAVRAVVAQRSGEDWSNAALSLVTAAAETRTELPELSSLRIGRRQAEPPQTGWRPPPEGADRLYADFDRAFGAAPKAAPPRPPARWEERTEIMGEIDELEEQGDDQSEVTTVEKMLASSMVERAAAAPPPPPPALAGMPAPGAAPPPPQARALFRSNRRRAAAPTDVEPFAPPAPEPEAEAQAQAVRADEALLDYAGLRMAGPKAAERGHLRRQRRADAYLEDLRRADWAPDFDVAKAVDAERAMASSVAERPAPEGHSFAFPEDYDYAYRADTRLDIASDGEFHSVALTASDGDCALLYVVAPRESTDVFRVARMANPLDAPLVPGPIDVYLGGEFLLATRVAFTPPGGTLRFGLGVEQAVKAVRNTSFREDSAGLLGGARELHHQIRIEVQSHLPRAIDLEVRERVPVTREDDDDIRVELGGVSPAWERWRPDEHEQGGSDLRGGYRWLLGLEPRGKAELKAGYVIRISSKQELVGGNRRER